MRDTISRTLALAVVGLAIALVTGCGSSTSGGVGSVVVHPLFPVTGLKFSGEVATFTQSSSRTKARVTIDWGDGSAPSRASLGRPVPIGGGRYTRAVNGVHTYSQVATYLLTVKVASHSASNLAVVTDCFCVTKLPTAGRTVDLGPVSGRVAVRPPGSAAFEPLTAPREVPVGSQLNTTNGSLVMMAGTTVRGKLSAGLFAGGLFQVLQPANLNGLVDLKLQGVSATRCRSLTPTILGRLHVSANGAFRTSGRFSAATVHGTEWTTTEECEGTLTRVQRGSVAVRDLRTGRTNIVSAGHTYLARAR